MKAARFGMSDHALKRVLWRKSYYLDDISDELVEAAKRGGRIAHLRAAEIRDAASRAHPDTRAEAGSGMQAHLYGPRSAHGPRSLSALRQRAAPLRHRVSVFLRP